jgi:hypothetical protein
MVNLLDNLISRAIKIIIEGFESWGIALCCSGYFDNHLSWLLEAFASPSDDSTEFERTTMK